MVVKVLLYYVESNKTGGEINKKHAFFKKKAFTENLCPQRHRHPDATIVSSRPAPRLRRPPDDNTAPLPDPTGKDKKN